MSKVMKRRWRARVKAGSPVGTAGRAGTKSTSPTDLSGDRLPLRDRWPLTSPKQRRQSLV